MNPTRDNAHDLQAFCHRLGSPLGALLNQLALIEMDRGLIPPSVHASLDAARRSADGLTAVLESARAWIQAHDRPLEPRSLDGEELGHRLGTSLPAHLDMTVDPGALDQLAADLAADGALLDATLCTGTLVLRYAPRPERGIDFSRGDGLLDPFGPAGAAPRWAAAGVLATRLGGRLELGTEASGTPCAHVILPLGRPVESAEAHATS